MEGAAFTVVLPTVDNPPRSYFHGCFSIVSNTTRLVYHKKRPYCPGALLEILFTFLNYMKVKRVDFRSAAGWTHRPAQDGVVDIVSEGGGNITTADFWIKSDRAQYVQYSAPIAPDASPCFIVCGSEHLNTVPDGFLRSLLFSRSLLTSLSIGFLVLFSIKFLSKQPRDFKSILGLALASISLAPGTYKKRRFLWSFLESATFFALLVTSEVMLKSKLLATLTIQREFPYKNLDGVAHAIKHHNARFSMATLADGMYQEVRFSDRFASIRSALDGRKPYVLRNILDPWAEILSGLNIVYIDASHAAVLFSNAGKYGLDCICKVLDHENENVFAYGLPKSMDFRQMNVVNYHVSRLREYGIVPYIFRKFRMVIGRNSPLLDTNPSSFVHFNPLSIQILRDPFIFLSVGSIFALLVFCYEYFCRFQFEFLV